MKILFVTLSNIGDCIMTLPVLDALREKYPGASISCLVPPRPQELFTQNPAVERVIIFDKHAPLAEKIKLFLSLSRERFDLVVDLRNSFFGAFLPAKKSGFFSGPLRRVPAQIKHSKDRHLFRALGKDHPQGNLRSLDIQPAQRSLAQELAGKGQDLIVMAPGAKSKTKCWNRENFARLCAGLAGENNRIVLVGDKMDEPACEHIQRACPGVLNMCGKTSLGQLAAILESAKLLISNDSAVMHLASYLNVPVVAVFGPTDEKKYGPWADSSAVVKKDIFCRPCSKAACRYGSQKCLEAVKPDDVLAQVRSLLKGISQEPGSAELSRILICRTDRLGDVLLSTPVIKALRRRFPQSYIAMMVSPYTREAVEGNPGLDEVIVFDKKKYKGLAGSLRFAKKIRQKKFDLAVVLHPTARVHLLVFFAGIKQRLGYDRKLKFLLTRRFQHTKQHGQKHESEYALDLIRSLGIGEADTSLFMPIRRESEEWVEELLKKENIGPEDKLLVVHPAASCRSKIWPAKKFASTAERLAKEFGFRVAVVASAKDTSCAQEVIQNMQTRAMDLSGKTSLSQLASLIKRAQLFISTDSGPVHIASALGTPQITIFGRNQPGLSPLRWGPRGARSRILHKSVGCQVCLAHACQKDFACIKAVTEEDVLKAARELLALK